MNIEQKLSFFSNSVMQEAEMKRTRIMEEIDLEMKTATENCEKEAQDLANAYFMKQKYIAEQEKNKIFMAASTEAKKNLATLKDQLMAKLRQDVVDMLTEFINTPEYEVYLEEQLKHYASSFCEEAKFFLMERDIPLMQSKIPNIIMPAKVDFIGGFKMIDKNILIDNSFCSRLDNAFDKRNIGV